ncbi:ABC transporter permease [Mesorhizobium sp. B2-6-5]|uniref:ABC transporter permease n=1 Tax=Mesorhizobium sp. B2-6-5 TaxID=2589912 RepID=UPI0015E36A93|nr:ABC transporter permease [Mesorhizobium sp. B2-6-5]
MKPGSFRTAASVAALLLPCLVVFGGLQVLPLLKMIQISFSSGPFEVADSPFQSYRELVADPYFQRIVLRTFALAFLASLACAVLGYPVAYYFTKVTTRKRLVFILIISPLLVGIVVRTLGWTIVLGSEGLVNNLLIYSGLVDQPVQLMGNFWSALTGVVHILLPFMILSIASVLAKLDPAVVEAAAVSGASPWQRFVWVILPLSFRGVAAGITIVFCLAVGSYITPLWLGQGKVVVMSMAIYDQMLVMVDWPSGAAASVLLMGVAVIALLGHSLLMRVWTKR